MTTLRSALFSWFGIAGAILTVFSNLQGIIDLAKWANWLTEKWGDAVSTLLGRIFGLIELRTDDTASMMIGMALFVIAIAIGARLNNYGKYSENWPIRATNVFNWHILAALAMYLGISFFFSLGYTISITKLVIDRFPVSSALIGHLIYMTAIVLGLRRWPASCSIFVAICMVLLSYTFGNVQLHRTSQPNVSQTASALIAIGFAVTCGITVVAIAPPRAFAWRLAVVMFGVATLAILNLVTVWDITAEPPAP